jgi:hypothetical protein
MGEVIAVAAEFAAEAVFAAAAAAPEVIGE